MSENKKYYYLKLKDNFYDSEEMIILQNMPDGYLYSDILLKLYLRSLKNNGKLMFKDMIPYTPSVLAQVVRHQVGTVEKALQVFQDLGLVEVLDNGAIFMSDIQNFIGKSTTEADRVRKYRKKIDQEELGCTNVQQLYDKSTPEIDIDIDIEKDIDIDIDNIYNSKEAKEIVKCYQENIGLITPAAAEIIFSYLETMDYKMIIEAIKKASAANVRNCRYINGILKDWDNKGYKFLSDITNEKPKPKKITQTYDGQREYENLDFLYANKKG